MYLSKRTWRGCLHHRKQATYRVGLFFHFILSHFGASVLGKNASTQGKILLLPNAGQEECNVTLDFDHECYLLPSVSWEHEYSKAVYHDACARLGKGSRWVEKSVALHVWNPKDLWAEIALIRTPPTGCFDRRLSKRAGKRWMDVYSGTIFC